VVVSALVMAGGRATRMNSTSEKALLEVGGKPMLERVIDALRASNIVHRIVVAVTAGTPLTAGKARKMNVEVIETPGQGYQADMRYAIKNLGLSDVLVVSADIPFITSGIIKRVVQRFRSCGKPALAVMAPASLYDRLGISPAYVFETGERGLVPVGINLIDGTKVDMGELDEEILVTGSELLILNVNSIQELKLARERCERPH